MSTPLPELDRGAADAFWRRYLAATGAATAPGYTDLTCFGDSVELADELIALVIEGRKRATAASVAEYEAEAIALPEVGDRWIACDGRGRPRVVVRTTDVRVGPLSSVDEAFAWDEGEGDRTRSDWLRAHTDFFERSHAQLGVAFGPDILVVFERFEVSYAEPK